MAVDEYLDTLFLAGQRPHAGLKQRIANLRTRFLAHEELSSWDHADNMLDLLQPDLQRLSDPQWAELQRAHALWGTDDDALWATVFVARCPGGCAQD